MDAGTLDTDTGTNGVDAVVVALDGNLGALTGNAGDGTDDDEAVMNLGHLLLKQAAQEVLAGARNDDLGVVVGVVHLLDDGPHDIALAVDVGGNLLFLGKKQLVLVIVEQQHLTFPHLIYFTGYQLSLKGLELVVDSVLLQVEYLAG